MPEPTIPANLTAVNDDPEYRTTEFQREHHMRAASRTRAFAQAILVAASGIALLAGPASAQKQGGSVTMGLELDIAGFDILKVGVYDTAALTAASALFDTLTTLDDKGVALQRSS